ncbi:lipase [Flexivirga endophytica]|uniref:Lipase n=1 Tax=Flexivirga endophytica TaxID=1849103 RepID=A0A916T031_9MICO|nr:lipase [Flexivirga endophytica]GHB57882.1 lipase [Flexivirga endophytica]
MPDDSSAAGASSAPPASGASPAAYRPQQFHGSPANFYVPPKPMPKVAHGTLLRYQRTKLTIPGGTAWKVMYASTSLAGRSIAVTGIVVVPTGNAPEGGWKLISVAHGTTGIADDCAPSRFDVPENVDTTSAYTVALSRGDYRRFAEDGYLKAGYVLSFTDYEGLGTPGVHPYLVGPSERRSVLDAARAARRLPHTPVRKSFAIWGYSQGGHAAAWANDLAAKWTPELHLMGSVAGGPVSELNLVANTLGSTSMEPSLFFMIIAGYAAAYPELHPSDVLTPAGIRVMQKFEAHCGAYPGAVRGQKLSDLVKPGFDSNTAWQRRLGESNPGQYGSQAPAAPLLILHSADDEVVPAFLSKTMLDRICRIGWTVERRIYHNGKGHVAEVPNAMADALPWINARMAGKKPASNCTKK